MINCFTFLENYKEAKNLVSELNIAKSPESHDFYIDYDYIKSNPNSNIVVRGNVTENDWANLNLEENFIRL